MDKPRHQRADVASFVSRVLIVLALGSLFLLAWHLRGVLLLLFGALVVATIFRALAMPFRRYLKLPHSAAVMLAVLLLVAALVTAGWLFGTTVALQMRSLSEMLPKAWGAVQQVLADWGLADEFQQWLGGPNGAGGSIAPRMGRVVMSVGVGLLDALVVFFGGIFLAAQPNFYRTGAIKLVPKGKRALIADAMNHSQKALGLWLKAQLISMAIVGSLTGFGLWLIGVPSAIALGILAALLEFVPFAGPMISGVIGVTIALMHSPQLALYAAGLYLVVQQIESYIIYPLVQQYAADIPALVLLFALIAFGMLFGIVGVIFAAPLTVVTFVLVKRLYVVEALHTATPIPGDDD